MMNAEAREEHRWLQRLVGEWACTEWSCAEGTGAESGGGTDGAPEAGEWEETVRSLGPAWIVCEGRAALPHDQGASVTVMTLGYDPAKGRFVGTFVGSMMTNLWVYEGELDPEGRVLTLHTQGPSFDGSGKTVPYRDLVELVDDEHRTLTSLVQGEDGSWRQIMQTHYRRAG